MELYDFDIDYLLCWCLYNHIIIDEVKFDFLENSESSKFWNLFFQNFEEMQLFFQNFGEMELFFQNFGGKVLNFGEFRGKGVKFWVREL